MNPADIFKSTLGAASNALIPGANSLFQLGSSLFGGGASQSTPKQAYSSSLQSSVPQSTIPAGPQSKLPTPSTGGNISATTPSTPKSAYIASQTGGSSLGSMTPSTGTPGVNPNAAYQGISTPGNIDQNSPQYKYQKAFDSYLASLQPSDAETTAEKNLAGLQLQAQKDNDYALEKPGQTLGFATGEAARVARNNSYGITAASDALNSLSGSRTSRTNATKAQLDFEKSLYDDSVTAAKPDYQSVSPGSTLFDTKTGKSVYTAPTTATQNGGSSGSGGSSATVQAIIANPGLWSTLTPSAKTSLIPQLVAAGFDTTKLNLLGLPAGQQSDLETFGTVQNYISDLLAKGDTFEGVGGLGSGSVDNFLFKNLGYGSAEGQSNRNLIGQIQGAIAKLRGGTSFTPNEQTLLDTYTPTINDSDASIKQKLTDLNTFINNKKTNLTSLAGGTLPTGSTSITNQPSSLSGGGDYAAYLQAIGSK